MNNNKYKINVKFIKFYLTRRATESARPLALKEIARLTAFDYKCMFRLRFIVRITYIIQSKATLF